VHAETDNACKEDDDRNDDKFGDNFPLTLLRCAGTAAGGCVAGQTG
jgi:hypothetical protein